MQTFGKHHEVLYMKYELKSMIFCAGLHWIYWTFLKFRHSSVLWCCWLGDRKGILPVTTVRKVQLFGDFGFTWIAAPAVWKRCGHPHHCSCSGISLGMSGFSTAWALGCSRVQVSVQLCMVQHRRIWPMSLSTRLILGPGGPSFLFLTVTECPSYSAFYRWWSGLPRCCCPYLEQSAPTCHVLTFHVCFSRSLQGFPLQALGIMGEPVKWGLHGKCPLKRCVLM